MNDESSESLEGPSGESENATLPLVPLSVLILWESVAAASAAKQICRELQEAGQLPEWRDSMWKFELLSMRGFREMAGREAAEADWIIVAFENDSELPPAMQQWLEAWKSNAPKKSQTIVALRVSQSSTGVESRMSAELRSFAHQLGCAFQVEAGGSGKPPTTR